MDKVKENKNNIKEIQEVKETDSSKEKDYPCLFCKKNTHRSLLGCDNLKQII